MHTIFIKPNRIREARSSYLVRRYSCSFLCHHATGRDTRGSPGFKKRKTEEKQVLEKRHQLLNRIRQRRISTFATIRTLDRGQEHAKRKVVSESQRKGVLSTEYDIAQVCVVLHWS